MNLPPQAAGVRAGDPKETAIPRLFELHGPKLYALARRVCGNEADAEELVQETFLQAHRKWDQFEGRADPGTWLYTIAVRACRRRRRKRAGEPARIPALSELLPFGESRSLILPASGDGGPLDAQIRREATEAMEAAIARLPEPFRMAVVLKDIAELPVEDVAAALGVKPATVKTRVHRARLMLRAALMSKLPRREADEPLYEKRVCLDLLRAKLDAMDRGRHIALGRDVLCDRCRSVFAELDLAQDACGELSRGEMPERTRREVLRALEGAGGGGPARGSAVGSTASDRRARPR